MQGLRWATGNVNWQWIFTWTAKLMNRKEKNRILFACTAANRKLMFWLIDSGSMARAALRNLCQNWQFALPFPKVFHLSCYKFLSFRLCLMWIFFCCCVFVISLFPFCCCVLTPNDVLRAHRNTLTHPECFWEIIWSRSPPLRNLILAFHTIKLLFPLSFQFQWAMLSILLSTMSKPHCRETRFPPARAHLHAGGQRRGQIKVSTAVEREGWMAVLGARQRHHRGVLHENVAR